MDWISPENIKWIITTFLGLPIVAVLVFRYQRKKDKDNQKIEFIRARVDTSVCHWRQDEENEQAFFKKTKEDKDLSFSPIFDFTFINHFPKLALLSKINVKLKFLPLGLSGPYVEPEPIKPFAKYVFEIKGGENSFELPDPIRIAPQEVGRFQVELLFPGNIPMKDRYTLYFSFEFNNGQKVSAPVILINSDNEEGKFRHSVLC